MHYNFNIRVANGGNLRNILQDVADKLNTIHPSVGRCSWQDIMNGWTGHIDSGATPEMIEGMMDQYDLLHLLEKYKDRHWGNPQGLKEWIIESHLLLDDSDRAKLAELRAREEVERDDDYQRRRDHWKQQLDDWIARVRSGKEFHPQAGDYRLYQTPQGEVLAMAYEEEGKLVWYFPGFKYASGMVVIDQPERLIAMVEAKFAQEHPPMRTVCSC